MYPCVARGRLLVPSPCMRSGPGEGTWLCWLDRNAKECRAALPVPQCPVMLAPVVVTNARVQAVPRLEHEVARVVVDHDPRCQLSDYRGDYCAANASAAGHPSGRSPWASTTNGALPLSPVQLHASGTALR